LSTYVEPAPDRRVALFWLVTTTVVWGSSFFAMKSGIAEVARGLAAAAPGTGAHVHAPAVFLIARFFVSAILLAAITSALPQLFASRRAFADALLLALPFAIGFVLQLYGLAETSATVAAFLTSTYVFWVPAIALAHAGVRPPARLLVGGVLAIAGIALLTGAGAPDVAPIDGAGLAAVAGSASAPAAARPIFGRGEALSLACAFAFAAQVYLTDIYSRRTGAAGLALGSVGFTVIMVALGLVAFEAGRAALTPAALLEVLRRPRALAAVLYTAAFSTVLALWAMYRYQRAVSPTRASLIYAIEPAAAAAFAWVLAGERFGAPGGVGCAMILAGNVIAEIGAGGWRRGKHGEAERHSP
jgi:drug/metabolite transporter (DMT)-like permease